MDNKSLTSQFRGKYAQTVVLPGAQQVFIHSPCLATGSTGSGVWVQPLPAPNLHSPPPPPLRPRLRHSLQWGCASPVNNPSTSGLPKRNFFLKQQKPTSLHAVLMTGKGFRKEKATRGGGGGQAERRGETDLIRELCCLGPGLACEVGAWGTQPSCSPCNSGGPGAGWGSHPALLGTQTTVFQAQ